MSRRIGFLTPAAGLIFGGFLAWSVFAPEASAQEVEAAKAETTAETPMAKSVPAPPAHRAEGIFDFYAANKAEQRIQAALRDPQGVEIEFIDTPLKDAMEFVADAHNITILIDEVALTEEGIAIDEPINRTLSGIKLDSALKIILRPLGLIHIVEDEVLKITTAEAADAKGVTRVYNTGYLKQVGVEPDALAKTIQATIQPEQWRSSTPSAAPAGEKETVIYRDHEGRLRLENIPNGQATVLRTAQLSTNRQPSPPPPQNSVQVLGDMLVVSAPISTHESIRDLLIQLDRRWELEHGKK